MMNKTLMKITWRWWWKKPAKKTWTVICTCFGEIKTSLESGHLTCSQWPYMKASGKVDGGGGGANLVESISEGIHACHHHHHATCPHRPLHQTHQWTGEQTPDLAGAATLSQKVNQDRQVGQQVGVYNLLLQFYLQAIWGRHWGQRNRFTGKPTNR